VRGERWEEFLIFHIVPLIFKIIVVDPGTFFEILESVWEGSDLEIGVPWCWNTKYT